MTILPLVNKEGYMKIELTQSNGLLLTRLEALNIRTHSQCRAGFCNSCRVKLLSGTVKYVQAPLAELDKNDVLICCAIATSKVTLQV